VYWIQGFHMMLVSAADRDEVSRGTGLYLCGPSNLSEHLRIFLSVGHAFQLFRVITIISELSFSVEQRVTILIFESGNHRAN